MLYAKVVMGLAVPGPFDYIVPEPFTKKIKAGCRVWVTLRKEKILGYVVGLANKSVIQDPKKILEVIDSYPVLDKNMLSLTKSLADYYCSYWGQVIEAALPEALRRGREISTYEVERCFPPTKWKGGKGRVSPEVILVQDLDGKARWTIYLREIKEALENKRSVIVLFPDFHSALKAQEIINSALGVRPTILYRKQPKELEEWLKLKQGADNIVLATRSGIFAPFNNLGLVIIDEEQDSLYKQDQAPHYNAREAAYLRVGIEKARLILGSASVSLESLYQARKNKIKYTFIPEKKDFPEVKIIDSQRLPFQDRKKVFILSRILEDAINRALNSKGKVLLFLNRRGFATLASCNSCGLPLKCPRCNINLAYHFKEDILNCHYCNFKMAPPKICPNCNAGYIRYTGLGTQKLESELSRIFAQARVRRLEKQEGFDLKDIDIAVATSAVIKQADYNFDLIGVLNIDNSLNRVDFRSSEKAFDLLMGLVRLTNKEMLIQTSFTQHHAFRALKEKDVNIFYDEELKQRKQLSFPPYRHIILVKLRGKKEDNVKEAARSLFEELNKCNKNKGIKIIAVNPGQPAKLRGNFYWQVLISSDNPPKAAGFLKINLKTFRHSGIIVTVDVDPL